MRVTELLLSGIGFNQRLHTLFALSIKTIRSKWCSIFVAGSLIIAILCTASRGDQTLATTFGKFLDEMQAGFQPAEVFCGMPERAVCIHPREM